MYDTSFEGHPLTGCLFEDTPAPSPALDASGSSTSGSGIPKMIDLRPYCTPVENQQQTNSCVANAIVGAVELLQKKAGQNDQDLSRLFLYYNARQIGDRETKDEGTYIHHGMAGLMAHGVCEERMWPFQQVAVNNAPTQACYQNATHYEAIQFARTPGDSALAALAQELPVAFGIVLPSACYSVAKQTGIIPPPELMPVTGPPSGHAMLIVGYDMDERMFIVRNSWGPGYGKDGYILIPFDIMSKYAHPDQFWAIGAIERAPGLRLMGMGVEEAAASYGAPIERSDALDGLSGQLRGELESRLGQAKSDFANRLRNRD